MNEDLVRGAFEALRHKDVAWFSQRLAPSVAEVLDEHRLRQAVDGIIAAFGEPVGCAEPTAFGGPASGQLSLECEGQRSRFVLLVSADDAGLITGLNVMPLVDHPRPPYAADAVTEREVTIAADPSFALQGTLTAPDGEGRWPVVVLVHGSGPNDRDETAYGAKPFLDLALGLAARGVASLRYEKRTRTYGAKVGLTVREEVIDDAVAAVHSMHAAGLGPVVVLGHSLGGTLVPAIAAQCKDLAGAIIVAGATRPMRDIVREQVDHLLATTPAGPNRDPLERLRSSLDTDDDLLGLPPSYWADLEANGPHVYAPSMTQPALVLQGGRDYQVTTADLEGWKALLPRDRAAFVLYPELDHLLASGTGPSSPTQYLQPSNVDLRVIEDIAEWVNGLGG
jgi:fermentation-respiration switch protein FrsA (DUF1100 family)